LSDFLTSLGILAIVGATSFLPWGRLPRWLQVVPPLLYVGSAGLMIATAGGNHLELASTLMIPVVWVALYGTRSFSAVVVCATVLALVVISAERQETSLEIVLGALVWAGMTGCGSAGAHNLRARLDRVAHERGEQMRQADALSAAGRRLTALRDPGPIRTEACLLAATIVTPADVSGQRVHYLQVRDGMVNLVAAFDDFPSGPVRSWPLEKSSYVAQVIRTRMPLCGPMDRSRLGEAQLEALDGAEGTDAVWIPLAPNGELDGVLEVVTRGQPISDAHFARAVSLCHIVELALGNALAYQRVSDEASTDPLTGLANRRGLLRQVAGVRGRRRFALLACDVDGLKELNDSQGHGAGDALLVVVAQTAQRVMRSGDLVARTGGDEFLAFLGDAGQADAARVGERLLAELHCQRVKGMVPAVSVGIACGAAGSELEDVSELADVTMYEAKASGGDRCAMAAPVLRARRRRALATPTGATP
jgi:diguanylate cyclase (GGDEF)-like protein